MSITRRTSPISPPPGQKDQSARLAASAKVDQVEGTTSQSIRKSSSRALPAGDLSGISTHLNPGGADGACADGAAGSLNLASETPSLTPALMAKYSTQYVSSSPNPAAMSGNSSPNPINPTAASPSLEAADLMTASAQVGKVESSNSLELFQRWLETAAHDAHRAYEDPPVDLSGQDLRLHLEGCEIAWLDCDVAMRLLMAFKLEHGA